MTTPFLAGSIVLVFLAAVAVWAAFLRIGLLWLDIRNFRASRLIFTAGILAFLHLAVGALAVAQINGPLILQGLVWLVGGLATIVISIVVVMAAFRISLPRALKVWLPTNASIPVMGVLLLMFCRAVLFEAYVIPSNAMAPTLLGRHLQATCSVCGSPNYCSTRRADYPTDYSRPATMICPNFHTTEVAEPPETHRAGDRILVAKFLKPRRWDIIVFRYPEDPSQNYVFRLVGLPGETITIVDGGVLADGQPLIPPERISGLNYLTTNDYYEDPEFPSSHVWGSTERPAQLADDEYFVLGDFSQQAKDSRYWEQAAPGHNAFAVPKSHFIGVVTRIYLPLSRMRSFR